MGEKRFSTVTGREITHRDAHLNGVRDGYEQCAIYLDAMALTWGNGTADGHEVASKALASAAECIRKLKGSI